MSFFKSLTILETVLLVTLLIFSFALYKNKNTISALNKELEETRLDLSLAKVNNSTLEEALNRQNEALNKLKVEAREAEGIVEIERIFIKDETCESNLAAYKNLFKELGR